MAYWDAGLVQEGALPSSDQYANGLLRLNDLLNFWQTQGMRLWTVQDKSITLVAGQGTYTMAPTGGVAMVKPLRVLQAYYLSSDNIRRPLLPLSWDEYLRLGQVTSQGAINSYFVDKQQTALVVKTWLVPDTNAATGTLHLLLQTQATNPEMLTADTGLPPEWFLAARWGLADELATGQPPAIVQRCAMKAREFLDALNNWDVEDASTFFAPDSRIR
jgi:hypothetical protein